MIVALLLVGIVAAMAVPRAARFLNAAKVEREATCLVADLRHLQEQSRSNGFRTTELTNFYERDSMLEMRLDAKGWRVQRSIYNIIYRHDLPKDVKLENLRGSAAVTINFGHNGGSVQNNTFKIFCGNDSSLKRYVIISGTGRVRVSDKPPSGEY